MIKNIVFDIGGVILDNNDEILMKFLNKTKNEIIELKKIVYGKRFKECLLGNLTQKEYMDALVNEFPEDKIEIEKLLMPKYQENVLPLKKETLNIMYELKDKNYKIYFLSNLTESTYYYLKDKLNILDDFDGGIFSWKEHLVKPNKEIYELLIQRYKLNKDKTIFFDDSLKNVQAGNEFGIKSIQFKNVEDIIKALFEEKSI